MVLYSPAVKDEPACRNGRRGRLKICCGQPRMGSSPIAGSMKKGCNVSNLGRFKSFLHFQSLITLDYSIKMERSILHV